MNPSLQGTDWFLWGFNDGEVQEICEKKSELGEERCLQSCAIVQGFGNTNLLNPGACSGTPNEIQLCTWKPRTTVDCSEFGSSSKCEEHSGCTWSNDAQSTCQAASVNGSCGSSINSCSAGIFEDMADTRTKYQWKCNGENGGSSIGCMACRDGYTYENGICISQETYFWKCPSAPEEKCNQKLNTNLVSSCDRSTKSECNLDDSCERGVAPLCIRESTFMTVDSSFCSPSSAPKCTPHCMINPAATGLGALYATICSQRTSKDSCERDGWDGQSMYACISSSAYGFQGQILPGECLTRCPRFCSLGQYPHSEGCQLPFPGFLGRLIDASHNLYIMPTPCRRGYEGEGGLLVIDDDLHP